jgi:hypothetical protein
VVCNDFALQACDPLVEIPEGATRDDWDRVHAKHLEAYGQCKDRHEVLVRCVNRYNSP